MILQLFEKYYEKKPPVFFYSSARSDVSLHCQSDGDYENLQCDQVKHLAHITKLLKVFFNFFGHVFTFQGRCWCADETTGRVTSTVVMEQVYMLPPSHSLTLNENRLCSKTCGIDMEFVHFGRQCAQKEKLKGNFCGIPCTLK